MIEHDWGSETLRISVDNDGLINLNRLKIKSNSFSKEKMYSVFKKKTFKRKYFVFQSKLRGFMVSEQKWEMNIFLAQSIQTQIELEEIADVKRQIITPSTSRTVIGIKQDGLLGGYNLTSPNMRIDKKNAMNMVSYTSFENFKFFKKSDKEYTGHELFSLIIPDRINITNYDDGKPIFVIKNGKLTEGYLKKDALGSKKKNNLIQLIWDEYGVEETKLFMDNASRLINNFNLYNGFTVGIADISVAPDIENQIHKILETTEVKVANMITEVENNPDLMDDDLFERTLFAELNVARDDVGKLIMNNSSLTNNLNIMSQSGSKGDPTNIGQMSGCVGLQSVEGKLAKKKVNNRTLPYFHENDDTAVARGLIKQSFLKGVKFPEFFFLNTAAREGLIDQAIKSVTGDTPLVIMEDGLTKYINIGEWIDKQLTEEQERIEYHTDRDMELLKLEQEAYIPTTDQDGVVTWGKITAITRHNPGNELYEIKTHGGRKVIVTESHSLLIWNKDSSIFERMSTPNVKIGDFVPVTMNLPNTFNVMNNYDKLTCKTENEMYQTLLNYSLKGIYCDIKFNNGLIQLQPRNKNDITYHNDTVLDAIVEIRKLTPNEKTKYPKVYDMTVPSTLNFGLANGLHVVDTGETGYMQRKLIKTMEDGMVKYDGTVRLANNGILQFIYGDSGTDTTKQYEHSIKLVEMSNSDIAGKYCFADEDLKKYKGYGKKENQEYLDTLIEMRDLLQSSQLKTRMSFITLNSSYMLPVNIYRIVESEKQSEEKGADLDPQHVIDGIEFILKNENTRLVCLTKKERENKNSLKYKDDYAAKTILRIALYEYISPKRCIKDFGLNKTKFDNIVAQIIQNFNKNMIEPGEMVGIIAAQAMGEPLTQLTLNAFHRAGISSMNTTTSGIPRVKELLSLSKKIKTPQTTIFLTKEFMQSRDMANKIASHIKYITIAQLRKKIDIYYEPDPFAKGSFREKDNVYNVFYGHNPGKNSCQADIASLPWLMRIVLDREKLLEKEVTLLDIKSKFCNAWEKRYSDMKAVKKEERAIFEKVTQCAILSNTDNDDTPIIHIRFDMTDIDFTTINEFIDTIVDKFKLKGLTSITDSVIVDERVLSFDNPDRKKEPKNQFVIYTVGTNMYDLRYVMGIDIYKTICNDVIQTYEIFGIEAARTTLIKEIVYVYGGPGNVNFQHLSILADIMTNGGSLISIDRHGMNKSDTDPLSRASFEKTVDQMLSAAVFCEVDKMKGISSRIMAGMVIKGGTGLCDLILDVDMIEKSEFTEDIGQKYMKTYNELTTSSLVDDMVNKENTADVFIPNY